MLKLKLQYFGHLMLTANSLEKTLMLGKTRQQETWAAEDMMIRSITDSVDMNLSKPLETAEDREVWHAAVQGVAKNQTRLSD